MGAPSRHGVRWGLGWLVLVAACGGHRPVSMPMAVPIPGEAVVASPGDPVLVEVRLGTVAATTVEAHTIRDTLYLPVASVFDLLEVRRPISRAYQTLDDLARVLETPLSFDESQSLVRVTPSAQLPIVRRLLRTAARQRLRDSAMAQPVAAAAELPGWSGIALDYDVHTTGRTLLDHTTYRLGLASAALGGVAVSRVRGNSGSEASVDLEWYRTWPESRWLTGFRLGDVATQSLRTEQVRGISLTNRPPFRPLLLEALPFTGSLPPGWSVDAFRSGRLIGFDSAGAGGRYRIMVPVHYGENPIDLIAYGPNGEIRDLSQSFRAVPMLLRSGATEYAVAAGQCQDMPCRWLANADVAVGLTSRLSARAGLTVRADDSVRSWRPYGTVTAAPSNALGLDFEHLTGLLTRAAARYEPSVHRALTLDLLDFAGGLGTRREWRLHGRVGSRGRGTVGAEAMVSRAMGDSGATTVVRAAVAVPLPHLHVRPFVRVAWGSLGADQSAFGLEGTVLPAAGWPAALRRLWLRADAEVAMEGGLRRSSVAAMTGVGTLGRLETMVTWERNRSGPVFSVGLVTQLSQLRYAVRGIADPAASGRMDQVAGGSAVWDRKGGRVMWSAEPAIERAGLAGVVFLDLDGNGSRSSDEPVLSGTRIFAAGRALITDRAGRFELWGVQPFEPIHLAVDSASLADPRWMPDRARQAVIPRPGEVVSIQVPIVVGAILEGRMEWIGDAVGTLSGGVELVLEHVATGSRQQIEPFSDGSFYQMGLRPGRYRLFLDGAVASTLGLAADPVTFDLAAETGAGPSQLVVIALRSREDAVAIRR